MAIAIAVPFPSPVSGARASYRAPLRRAFPRVYSPFGPRRLARPMAVPLAGADSGAAAPPGRQRLPFVRSRRG